MNKQCIFWLQLLNLKKVILFTSISLIGTNSVIAEEFRISDSIGISQSEQKDLSSADLRNQFLNQDKSVKVLDKLLTQGTGQNRKEALTQAQQQKSVTNNSIRHLEYRIYDAHTHLIGDEDNDGYYQKFSITFDADSESSYWETVYAKLYLSSDGGNTWLHYFTTKDFIIEDNASYDDYEVVTTLYNGYPAGEYDVLIDLYEHDDEHHIVATYSSFDDNDLFALPLESKNYDARGTTPSSKSHGSGGGSFNVFILMSMILMVIKRSFMMNIRDVD